MIHLLVYKRRANPYYQTTFHDLHKKKIQLFQFNFLQIVCCFKKDRTRFIPPLDMSSVFKEWLAFKPLAMICNKNNFGF